MKSANFQNSQTTLTLAIFVVSLLTAMGCGSGGPAPSHVQGTVVCDDKPLDRGVVLFVPVAPNLPSARADIQSGGQYELSAAPGEYKVIVTSFAESTSPFEPEDPRYVPPASLLPAKYSSIVQTPLICTVAPEQSVVELKMSSH